MLWEAGLIYVNYLLLFFMLLVSVAFVTLVEQKVLGSTQVRVGPNYVGYFGVFQPFSDAVKLFGKESVSLTEGNFFMYYVAPIMSLSLTLFLWVIFPFKEGGLLFSYGLLFFVCVSGVMVYPILMMGWSSNCKYSVMGSLRAVAQMISYEVSLAVVFLSVIWMSGGFDLKLLMNSQACIWNLLLFFPLSLVWFGSSLAETNRSPYDFSEGESELVSGFNTEYSSVGFTLIFISEYGNILFMGVLFTILFLGNSMSGLMVLKSLMLVFIFIWVRGTMPRYRYDKLMNLAWKSFLPISLMFFIFYLNLGESCSYF
uniref:NADH-ubiquinone oxidoreductase chain 1 n=1 Tax=Haploginglymus sp. JP-2016 TaxID=1867951 RepID=A0A330IVG6_9CRUS|nr:ND1 [Haploginglymus sp. JP-2016]